MSQNVQPLVAVAVQQPLAPYLGVRDASTAIPHLGALAVADCDHDFSHAKTETAYKEIIKSYSPSYGLSVVAFQKSAMEVKSLLDPHTNAYSFFKDHLPHILPLGKPSIELKDENAATALIGLDFASYRAQLIQHGTDHFKADLNPASLPPLNVELSNNYLIKGNTDQQYKITAYPTKIKSTKLSIRGALRTVAPVSNVFVMIIDASFISMTEIKKALGLPGDRLNEAIIVYIIRSIESSADAATKISNLDDEDNDITVYYLDDDDYVSISPPFDMHAMNQMSNLFTTLSVKCYRKNDDEITAEITNSNGSITTIHDIGNKSEINKAASLAFEQLIVQNAKTNRTLTQQSWEEILVFLLLKRSGDWRQALCLLDRDRKYSVKNMDNTPIDTKKGSPTITLNQLITQHKSAVEIFLMTHDRILLTYALYLGLNVGYSLRTPITGTESSVTWLLYFKNMADAEIDKDKLKARFEELQAIRIDPSIYKGVYAHTIAIITRMATKPISVVSHFVTYVLHIRIICHFLKQFVSSTIVETLLTTIDNKSKAISSKIGGDDYSFFTELLQLQTEITNSRNIIDTHHKVLEKIAEYNSYLESGHIEQYVKHVAQPSYMPSTFVAENETIHSLNDLLTAGIFIYSGGTGPVAVYHRFLTTTLSSAGEDYKQIIGMAADPFYDAIKAHLPQTVSTSIDYRTITRRVQTNNWKQIEADIKKEGLPLVSSGGGQIRQFGGAAGDVALLSAQNNIISLRENILPYDNKEAIRLLTVQHRSLRYLPKLIEILGVIYDNFIGTLYEPYYTDFILECIDIIILPRLRDGILTPERVKDFIASNHEAFINLSRAYPHEPLYNKLDYGMSFVENDRAFTIADRFIISEKEASELNRIIPICINIPDVPALADPSFHFRDDIFDNVYAKPFLLYRYTLYILDMINNKIDSFDEIYDSNKPHNDSDELHNEFLYHYDDITYRELTKYYTLLRFIDQYISDWNITRMVYVYWFWKDMIRFNRIELDRVVSRKNLKELCATARIKCILKYHAATRTVINTEQTFDLFLNIMPSWVTLKTITDLLPPGDMGSDNDIISKSMQYIMTPTITINQVVSGMPQQPLLLNQREQETILEGLVIRFKCVCVSAYYCSRHITHHDNLNNNISLLVNLFDIITKFSGNHKYLYRLQQSRIRNHFIHNAVIHGLIIVSILHKKNNAIKTIIGQLQKDKNYSEYDIISDVYQTFSIIDHTRLTDLTRIILSSGMNNTHIQQFLAFKNIEVHIQSSGGSRKRWATHKSSRKLTHVRFKKTIRKKNKKQKRRTMKK